jgi:hypothetical protein
VLDATKTERKERKGLIKEISFDTRYEFIDELFERMKNSDSLLALLPAGDSLETVIFKIASNVVSEYLLAEQKKSIMTITDKLQMGGFEVIASLLHDHSPPWVEELGMSDLKMD